MWFWHQAAKCGDWQFFQLSAARHFLISLWLEETQKIRFYKDADSKRGFQPKDIEVHWDFEISKVPFDFFHS